MELWTSTHILCDLEIQWKIHHTSAITQETSLIDEASDPLSYALVTSQIRALVEKRAGQLSKKVLQNLEKKLMHNNRGFDIFLASVVLLNCVERTTWLFHTWENETYAQRVSQDDQCADVQLILCQWPLERQPRDYWSQAERFSDILNIVLKMRTVAPKTSPRPDDYVLMPVEPVNENVMAWYGTVQLTGKSTYIEHCAILTVL